MICNPPIKGKTYSFAADSKSGRTPGGIHRERVCQKSKTHPLQDAWRLYKKRVCHALMTHPLSSFIRKCDFLYISLSLHIILKPHISFH